VEREEDYPFAALIFVYLLAAFGSSGLPGEGGAVKGEGGNSLTTPGEEKTEKEGCKTSTRFEANHSLTQNRTEGPAKGTRGRLSCRKSCIGEKRGRKL